MASRLCFEIGLLSVGQDPVKRPSARVLKRRQSSGSGQSGLKRWRACAERSSAGITAAHEPRLRVGTGTL